MEHKWYLERGSFWITRYLTKSWNPRVNMILDNFPDIWIYVYTYAYIFRKFACRFSTYSDGPVPSLILTQLTLLCALCLFQTANVYLYCTFLESYVTANIIFCCHICQSLKHNLPECSYGLNDARKFKQTNYLIDLSMAVSIPQPYSRSWPNPTFVG